MSMRTLLFAAGFFFAFVVNPAYITGCMVSESEPDFGEAEMLALLDAANEQGRWELESDGKTYEIELSLMQKVGSPAASGPEPGYAPRTAWEPRTALRAGSLWSAPAHACGTRTFTQSASACVTFTEVPLFGELTIRELSPTPHVVVDALEVEGRLWTDAARLLFAYLDVYLSDDRSGDSITLHSPDATSFELQQVDAMGLGDDGIDLSFDADGAR
jgi:hypothetical protein